MGAIGAVVEARIVFECLRLEHFALQMLVALVAKHSPDERLVLVDISVDEMSAKGKQCGISRGHTHTRARANFPWREQHLPLNFSYLSSIIDHILFGVAIVHETMLFFVIQIECVLSLATTTTTATTIE